MRGWLEPSGWALAFLGGSPYYLGAGLLLIAVALLLFRGKPEGANCTAVSWV